MAPLYRQGDRVLVDRDRTDVRKGDRVVVRTTTGETMAKEIASLTAKAVTLALDQPRLSNPASSPARTSTGWPASSGSASRRANERAAPEGAALLSISVAVALKQ